MSKEILQDIAVGFEEIKFKDLKPNMNILLTFHHGFEAGNDLVVRHAIVKECNGYVTVKVHESDDFELMLMPGCPVRQERYWISSHKF